jgi:hypothetical protein
MLGIRNEFQKKEPWQIVCQKNLDFCRDSLSYWYIAQYISYLQGMFQSADCNFDFYIASAPGGYAKLIRMMGLNKGGKALRSILRELRMTIISARK